MKTLDEVITALEICTSDKGGCEGCPYDIDCKPDKKWDDALHYLKEFRGLLKMWNDKLDKEQENPPLTWDELRTMDGKPVWLEYNFHISNDKFRCWCIIREFKPWHDTEIIITNNGFILSKNEQVTYWQAYRREHHEN